MRGGGWTREFFLWEIYVHTGWLGSLRCNRWNNVVCVCLCMFVCMGVDDTTAIGHGAMYDERTDRNACIVHADRRTTTN